jgi:hypothetical protein
MAAPLKGIMQPRLYTRPLRPLTRRTSLGYEVADFAELIGEPLLPWQRWAAIHALETVPGGDFRFRVILVLVARQNGKSQLKRTISLWRLYMDCAKLVLGVAQDVSLAREQWQYTIDTIEASPDLSAELGQVRRFNGDEWFRLVGEISGDDHDDEPFRLTSGGRYKIAASNRKAGRGLSVDELNFDELREQRNWDAWSALSKTTMARHNSQIWAMSNAGDDESVVLNQLRDAALSGRDPSICLLEWSAPDGCELDDTAAWRQANPALGITVSAAAIRTAMTTDPPNVFRTEVLCQKVDQLDGAIDLAAWKACADPSGTMEGLRDRVAVCFDVAPDGKHATLAVAAMLATGQVRTEIVRAWDNTTAARPELPELIAKIRPAAISWFPTGPGAAFSPMLRPAKDAHTRVQYVELAGMKVAEACQGLADLAKAGAVIHNEDPLLDSHIRGAQKLNAADGWRFTRRGGGHCDAAYAAAGAVYVALTMPAPKRARIRVLTA